MGNRSLDRNDPLSYDSLQRTKILNSIRIKGERIEKLELRSGMRKRRATRVGRMFCQIVGKMSYAGTEVARYLEVGRSGGRRF